MVAINARDVQDAWYQLLRKAMEEGEEYLIQKGSFAGSRRKTIVAFGKIEHPSIEDFNLWTYEVPPPTTIDKVEAYVRDYLLDSKLAEKEDYRYSVWISGGKIGDREYPNMLKWITEHITEGNAHCCINIGDNWLFERYLKGEGSTPCLRIIDLWISKGKLNMLVYFRSWDLVFGFPENMCGMAGLMDVICAITNTAKGSLHFSSKDLHIYEHNYQYAKTVLRIV